MLYSEFLKGTGCRDNDTNYKVYKDLVIIYMNTDYTKEHIYEMGKKLVDNSKSAEQVEAENKIKEEIVVNKDFIKAYKDQIENEMGLTYPNKSYIKYCKDMVKYHKSEIKKLKWILGGK